MLEGPLRLEEDLEQIRNDISLVRGDIYWISQFGPALMNIVYELRTIRRLMEIHMGEQTREEVMKDVEEDKEELRAFEEQNEKRMKR